MILASGPQTVRTTKPVEGRFPNVLNVFDPAEVITFVVDPKLLIGLLEVMMCVHPNCVTFHAPLKKDGRIGLLAKGHPDHNTGGQIADGVIVPLIARDDK